MEPVNLSVIEEEMYGVQKQEQIQVQEVQPKTFESYNYYDIYMTLLKNHEELQKRARKLELENEDLQYILRKSSSVLDGFTERIIELPVSKIKTFVALSGEDDKFYMSIDFQEKIRWLKSEKEFEKWCAEKEERETKENVRSCDALR